MVQTYEYVKQVNIDKLQAEFVAAGYDMTDGGLVYVPDTMALKVILSDSETKSPDPIVEAHVYSPYIQYNWQEIFSNASTAYSNAAAEYATALTAYNNAVAAYQAATLQADKNAALAQGIIACKGLADACKDAIVALKEVVVVIAKDTGLQDYPRY